MLSKSERKILNELAKLIEERDIRKIQRKKLQGQEKRKNTQKINSLEQQINIYFLNYSDDYKRVLKHRIKKKAQQMINDLIIILQIQKQLGIKSYEFLSNDKHILLRHYLPQSMSVDGIDMDIRGSSLEDLSKNYGYKDKELRLVEELYSKIDS